MLSRERSQDKRILSLSMPVGRWRSSGTLRSQKHRFLSHYSLLLLLLLSTRWYSSCLFKCRSFFHFWTKPNKLTPWDLRTRQTRCYFLWQDYVFYSHVECVLSHNDHNNLKRQNGTLGLIISLVFFVLPVMLSKLTTSVIGGCLI